MPSLYNFQRPTRIFDLNDGQNPLTRRPEEISLSESNGADGFRATQVLKVLWTERHLARLMIMGGAIPDGLDSYGRLITKILRPARYRESAPSIYPSHTTPYAIARNCTIEEFESRGTVYTVGGGNQWAEPTWAKLTVDYEAAEEDQGEEFTNNQDFFIREEIEYETEFLTVPPEGLFWDWFAPAGQPGSENNIQLTDTDVPGRQIKGGTWVIEMLWLVQLPSELWDWVDTVNAVEHRSIRYSNKTFTGDQTGLTSQLLMGMPVPEHVITPNGRRCWNVKIPIHYRREGWNQFYRKGRVDPIPIKKADGTDYLPYPPEDWTGIIPTPAAP